MELRDAIEAVKLTVDDMGELGAYEFDNDSEAVNEAIATILNAVVKGELKCESVHAAKK